jgi:hypothetical protein
VSTLQATEREFDKDAAEIAGNLVRKQGALLYQQIWACKRLSSDMDPARYPTLLPLCEALAEDLSTNPERFTKLQMVLETRDLIEEEIKKAKEIVSNQEPRK